MNYKSVIGCLLAISIFSCDGNKETKEKKIPENVIKDQTSDDASFSDSSIVSLNKLILEEPQNADLYVARAKQYLILQNFDAAINDYKRAIKIDSTNSQFYNALAETYFLHKNIPLALENFEKSENLDPKNIQTYLKRAQVNFLMKKFNETLKDADAALRINKFEPQAYYLKGITFLEVKDTSRAVSSLQTAVEQDPNHYNAFYQLGLIHFESGMWVATDYLKSALEIKPKSIDARYLLALNYQNFEKIDEALAEYENILEQDADFIDAVYNIGFIYSEFLDDENKAMNYFQKTVQIDDSFVRGQYMLGLLNERKKEYKIAEDYYRKTLKIQPDFTLAAQGLSRVTTGL